MVSPCPLPKPSPLPPCRRRRGRHRRRSRGRGIGSCKSGRMSSSEPEALRLRAASAAVSRIRRLQMLLAWPVGQLVRSSLSCPADQATPPSKASPSRVSRQGSSGSSSQALLRPTGRPRASDALLPSPPSWQDSSVRSPPNCRSVHFSLLRHHGMTVWQRLPFPHCWPGHRDSSLFSCRPGRAAPRFSSLQAGLLPFKFPPYLPGRCTCSSGRKREECPSRQGALSPFVQFFCRAAASATAPTTAEEGIGRPRLAAAMAKLAGGNVLLRRQRLCSRSLERRCCVAACIGGGTEPERGPGRAGETRTRGRGPACFVRVIRIACPPSLLFLCPVTCPQPPLG